MRRALVALVALVALSACAGGTGEASDAGPRPSAGPPCVAAGPVLSGSPSPSSARPAAPALADLALRCFDGGAEVRLARLGRPAVVNLWASWCGPCRKELPAFEEYARQAADRITVIGVATDTPRAAARSVIDDLGLTFAILDDRDQRLLHAVERTALPVTLFVDAHGRLAYLYNSTALDVAAIERLAAEHLGV